jgi:hypothetical protein
MPGWRVAARKFLAPHRRLLSAMVLVAILAFVANEIFAWGLPWPLWAKIRGGGAADRPVGMRLRLANLR